LRREWLVEQHELADVVLTSGLHELWRLDGLGWLDGLWRFHRLGRVYGLWWLLGRRLLGWWFLGRWLLGRRLYHRFRHAQLDCAYAEYRRHASDEQ
jgi:hypothetical protein